MPEELVILGTGAAEGVPGVFCACEVCTEAARRQGSDLRMRASYQFGPHLKVDWPPDSLAQMLKFGLDYGALRYLLITHSHHDHFYPHDLDMRRPGFSSPPEGRLHLYGNREVLKTARRVLKRHRQHRLLMHRLHLGEWLALDSFHVLPIRAAHAPGEEAFNFVVERRGLHVLVGTDTGWYPPQTWDLLRRVRLQVVLMDGTYGSQSQREHHLGADEVVEVKREMERLGILAPGARFIATHFSHNGGLLHHDLQNRLEPHGVEVAYDGLRIPLPS